MSVGAVIVSSVILVLLTNAQGLKALLFNLCSDWREEAEGFCSDNKRLFELHPGSSAEAPVAAGGRIPAQLLSGLGGFGQQQKAGRARGQ